MAKKTSKLKLKVKGPDLVQYSIWWVHHGDLAKMNAQPVADLRDGSPWPDMSKIPSYVYDEITDLLWDDAYKRTSVSIPDTLGINELVLTEIDLLAPARRLASGKYSNFVGILVYHADVTKFMHGNGFVTNYLGERESYKPSTLAERMTQFNKDARDLEELEWESTPCDPEVLDLQRMKNSKTLGERVEQFSKDVLAITKPPVDLTQYREQRSPIVQMMEEEVETDCNDAKESFCIWWLTKTENKQVNVGIRSQKINLPGYIADEIRRYENCITMGKTSIHESFPSEVKEIIDEHDAEDNIEANGIVIRNIDATNVERHGGYLTTLDMRAFRSDTHLFEELAIHKRPYSNEEMREIFLQHIRGLITYWGEIHPTDGKEAASGMAHSICAAISGCSMNIPGFYLVPTGTQEDAEYAAENGERPWPVVDEAIVDSLPDAGDGLHQQLYRDPIPVAQCEYWLSKKEWTEGRWACKWAWVMEVLIKETPFIRDRFDLEHPGVVLANAYRELASICLKEGVYFVPDEWDVLDAGYSFKWATDDPDKLENMLKYLSGYTLRGHF